MSHRDLFAKPLIFAVLCLSSVAATQVPWHLDYEKGLEALRSRNYQDAVESLRKALEVNRAPASRVKLYGTRYIPYYPWFHLGKALYELAESDEDKAAEYYEESVNASDVSIEYGEIKKEVALGAEIEALRENAVAQINMLRQKDEAMRYVTAGKKKFAAGELQPAYEEFLQADALLRDDPEVQSQIAATRRAIDERWRLNLIEQGRQALNDEQPDEAKGLAQEVLRRFPADSDADLLLLSVARYQAEEIERRLRMEAEQERKLIREREHRLRILSQVRAALANGRFTEARRLNSEILREQSSPSWAHYRATVSYSRKKVGRRRALRWASSNRVGLAITQLPPPAASGNRRRRSSSRGGPAGADTAPDRGGAAGGRGDTARGA